MINLPKQSAGGYKAHDIKYQGPYMSSRNGKQPGLAFLLKRAQHSFRTRVDDRLRPLKLTAPQFAVLAAVHADAGISNAALARLAFVTPQSMQGILAGLERARLLTRSPDPRHGRILRSTLTEKGRKLFQEARLRVDEVERLIYDSVGAENVALFGDMLARCADGLAPR
ncbi:MarR family winged helix-turn-helix transcriptional regulator [Bradyrhizobium sp. BR 1432]|uniref:MarR family winged helix-turn-helix transcriptional regulator n=1 Tax=Bradyrhizobium sp. BR 1432 TaxID=3447966 RepID=UPI003EE4C28E